MCRNRNTKFWVARVPRGMGEFSAPIETFNLVLKEIKPALEAAGVPTFARPRSFLLTFEARCAAIARLDLFNLARTRTLKR